MKLKETLIAWSPDNGKVKVGKWPDTSGWTEEYYMTGGASYTEVQSMSEIEAMHRVYRDAITLIIRDGIDPFAVHEEFLKIDEYEKCLSPDTPGAKV